nr:anti-sigma factor [Rhodococcus sp. HNM0569]
MDAVDDAERARIESALAAADPQTRDRFAALVRDVRETMAVQSSATAVPAPAGLFERILEGLPGESGTPVDSGQRPVSLEARRRRYRVLTAVAAAAAVIVVAVGGIGISRLGQDRPAMSVTEQVLTASDVRTVSSDLADGGTVTVVFSHSVDAGVVVMNDMAAPPTGSVYQMWLMEDEPVSAGMMEMEGPAPSMTTTVDGIDDASALAFTVEPVGGSPQPTGDPFAMLEFG